MKYASPELVVIGRAEVLVLGMPGLPNDHVTSLFTQVISGIALGLDD